MSVPLDSVGAIAGAIKELVAVIGKYIDSSDMRRLRKCVRNADEIVARIRKLGVDDKMLNKWIIRHERLNN